MTFSLVLFYLKIVIIICFLFNPKSCYRVKRVIGGDFVECGKQPRIASLRDAKTNQHLCGATVLTPEFAVTAAHCVYSSQYRELELLLLNQCNEIPTATVIGIMEHDLYEKYSRAHDIAILRIILHDFNNVDWINDNVLPNTAFGLTGNCKIYGYGTRNATSNETSEQLQEGEVRIVSLDECTQALGPYMAPLSDSGMLCAIGINTDTCLGDSGSPLICGNYVQAISSHGLSCGIPGVPAVYTSIGQHLNWINEFILQDYNEINT